MNSLKEFIAGIIEKFVSHSNDAIHDKIYWEYWLETIVHQRPLIVTDFSENLSLPLQQEPQSLYWLRKQVSILSGIITACRDTEEQKIYLGHFSQDRDHDQVYVRLALENMIPLFLSEDDTHIFIHSDNATHFKSSENYADIQELCNSLQITIIRSFGVPGHGKGEIDSCGGHIKTACRKGIEHGVSIKSASDCVAFLNNKFRDKKSPSYHISEISEDNLDEETAPEVLEL